MKTFKWIGLCLISLITLPSFGQVADDAYRTPSRAKQERVVRDKENKARAERMQEKYRREEAKRAWEAKIMEARQDSLEDWYNRRAMRVTVEDMEENLDRIDGDRSAKGGGKYAQRLRRFHDGNRLVIDDVDRVYVLDDMDYDPWTDSYYGYDRRSNVNISINYGFPRYRYGWGGYYGRAYYGWYDPWWGPRHAGWYDPWYDPWYSPWYTAWYDPWYGGYHGYYSPAWGSSYYWGGWYGPGYVVNNYYYTPRKCSRHGRSVANYGRNAQINDRYGRALGRSADRVDAWNNGYGNTRSNVSRSSNRRTYDQPTRRSWDNGFGNRSGSSVSRSSNSSTRSSGGSYGSGGSSTSRSSGTSGNSGTGASRRR